jgi:hypothetical protein
LVEVLDLFLLFLHLLLWGPLGLLRLEVVLVVADPVEVALVELEVLEIV